MVKGASSFMQVNSTITLIASLKTKSPNMG
jgi:hypothetical protein